MPNVLYISYDGMTDPLGQSQVLPYLKGLSAKGYGITLLSCEKPERFEKYRAVIEEICATAGIDWQPIPYTARPPVVSTVKDIRKLYRAAYALHAKQRFSIVHCRSYIAAMVGQSMKKKFGTKFLFDMRGFWADERVDGGLWSLSNPLYKFIYNYFKRKESEYLEQADHTISLTEEGKKEMEQWTHLNSNRSPVTVIPCCVDTELFDPAKIDPEQRQLYFKRLDIAVSQPVIGYVGSIGTWYLLKEMLACFALLRMKKPESVMVFITTEPAEMVLAAAEKADIPAEAVRVLAASRKEVPYYISLMDYSLFFIKPCYSKKASSPTKQGEIMAMGVPVLCNTGVGDTGRVVEKYHSGVATTSLSVPALNDALEQLMQGQYDANEIRRGAIEFYGLEKGIESYERVYRSLLT